MYYSLAFQAVLAALLWHAGLFSQAPKSTSDVTTTLTATNTLYFCPCDEDFWTTQWTTHSEPNHVASSDWSEWSVPSTTTSTQATSIITSTSSVTTSTTSTTPRSSTSSTIITTTTTITSSSSSTTPTTTTTTSTTSSSTTTTPTTTTTTSTSTTSTSSTSSTAATTTSSSSQTLPTCTPYPDADFESVPAADINQPGVSIPNDWSLTNSAKVVSNGGQSQSAHSGTDFVSITATPGGTAQGLSRTINNLDTTINYQIGYYYASSYSGSTGDCPTTVTFNGVAIGFTSYLGGSTTWYNNNNYYFKPSAATGTFQISVSCPTGSEITPSFTLYLDDIVMKPYNTACTP